MQDGFTYPACTKHEKKKDLVYWMNERKGQFEKYNEVAEDHAWSRWTSRPKKWPPLNG